PAVPVAPVDANRVVPHLLHDQHLEHRLEQLQGVGRFGLARRRAVCARAGRAGTLVAQILQRVLADMPVLPVDLDALGFGYGDVFRVSGQLNSLSTSRTPEMRRIAPTSFSSCFLSRTSTVISTSAPSWSTSVLASRLRMLVFSPESTDVSCISIPGRSSVCTTIFTGNESAVVRAHSTSILRSASYIRLCTFGHMRECTATPLPRVTYPTMLSPRMGLQHLAR